MITAEVKATVTVRETIVRAAIFYKGGIYAVAPPGRHHHVVRLMAENGLGPDTIYEQGFLTSTGRFVGRHVACVIAKTAGQILVKTCPENQLFSEDVW